MHSAIFRWVQRCLPDFEGAGCALFGLWAKAGGLVIFNAPKFDPYVGTAHITMVCGNVHCASSLASLFSNIARMINLLAGVLFFAT